MTGSLHPLDDAPSDTAAVSWHQEQFCEHEEIAADLERDGRLLLADQHHRVAASHRAAAAAAA